MRYTRALSLLPVSLFVHLKVIGPMLMDRYPECPKQECGDAVRD
jgi:hypothetical protein